MKREETEAQEKGEVDRWVSELLLLFVVDFHVQLLRIFLFSDLQSSSQV